MSQGSLPGKGKYGRELNKVVEFVLSHCHENGFINNPMSETHGPMYGHGFATLFLAEAYGAFPEAELRDRLAKATQLIVDTQNNEGGWRYHPTRSEADLSVTICQIMAYEPPRTRESMSPIRRLNVASSMSKRARIQTVDFAIS